MALNTETATLALAGLAALSAACGSNGASGSPDAAAEAASGGPDSSCVAFVPPASFNPSSPTVSFSGDVMPVFATSCAIPSCHGSVPGAQGGLYLGSKAGEVYTNLVGVASTEYPSLQRVKPGDPANSYLLYRIDGDACSLAGCTSPACAELMPQGGSSLGEAALLAVRAWIAQGAVSDVSDDAGSSDAATSDGGASDGGAGDGSASDASAPDGGGD